MKSTAAYSDYAWLASDDFAVWQAHPSNRLPSDRRLPFGRK
ncbi:hypothetical protein [Gordonia rubripertincta]|uniref:Uncharacterized protein n=1 Tax=Gordonia rubripertincta TaxID=36822 RepID=A0ABT4MRJ8_GORRU|nr:hypothetical protein [Gordonia rubripertincta]MCZ4549633.1 hypothetical protein [Gordonia rubripertincta]